MLAATSASRRGASRAVVVRARSAVVAPQQRRATAIRSIQSMAQTDRDTITRLLYSLGSKREVERHLRIFSSSSHPSQPAKFALELPVPRWAVPRRAAWCWSTA
uniref:Acetylglutamate kinase ARG6 n=1 Tax=Mycena chlorophos TaxID=658473 RepID=A0ABQ0LL55_MYCCL|nr:acetylglutamate kinase ARG6 [Mycena chlorophos]